jgi:fido (protein-threonine AMPylation protein)
MPVVPSCKVHRLCDRYDITLRDHFPGLREDEYEWLHRRTAIGSTRARAELLERARGPTAIDELALRAHRLTFEGVFLFAGRVRQPGEKVYVGHDEHEFAGLDAAAIPSALSELSATFGPIDRWPQGRRAFAQRAARFLRDFFAIHPFTDGNGRTGRLIVECAASRTGTLRIVPRATSKPRHRARDQREYLCALQEAHRRRGLTRAQYAFDLDQDADDGCTALARWWARQIIEVDAPTEAPPR